MLSKYFIIVQYFSYQAIFLESFLSILYFLGIGLWLLISQCTGYFWNSCWGLHGQEHSSFSHPTSHVVTCYRCSHLFYASPLLGYTHKNNHTDMSVFYLSVTKLPVFQTTQSNNSSHQEKCYNSCNIWEHFLWNWT